MRVRGISQHHIMDQNQYINAAISNIRYEREAYTSVIWKLIIKIIVLIFFHI